MAKQNFPHTIFVRADVDSTGTKDLIAYDYAAKAIEDDGPTDVAEYRLVSVQKLKKKVVDA